MKTKLLLVVIAFIATMASCTKDLTCENKISENGISSVATSSDGNALTSSIINEDRTLWNIKMNDVAANAKENGFTEYPAHSMIIKEKHDADGNITGYDVMYKDPSDENSVDGWLYIGLSADGNVIYNANARGASCQSCHSSGGKNVVLR